ncbi:MAG: hypothetical protein R3C49_16890 [Planctomycetaceae bacterium]
MKLSDHHRQIPEPSFPETELIRNSAPIPELSAGFRARVMAECSVSLASAARIRRWKIGGTVTAVCAVLLLIFVSLPQSETSPSDMAQQPPEAVAPSHSAPGPYSASSSSVQFPVGGSGTVAADKATPRTGQDTEKSQMNQVIEGLNGRRKIFDADMLPHF